MYHTCGTLILYQLWLIVAGVRPLIALIFNMVICGRICVVCQDRVRTTTICQKSLSSNEVGVTFYGASSVAGEDAGRVGIRILRFTIHRHRDARQPPCAQRPPIQCYLITHPIIF